MTSVQFQWTLADDRQKENQRNTLTQIRTRENRGGREINTARVAVEEYSQYSRRERASQGGHTAGALHKREIADRAVIQHTHKQRE
jgi:hypothetical protein